MHDATPRTSRIGWLTWLVLLSILTLSILAVIRLTVPTVHAAKAQIIGTAIPSEMISGQRVTAFAIVGFSTDVKRGWIRMEACPQQRVKIQDCLRWPIIPISPSSSRTWAGSLGHLGMHELGDYEVTARTYVDVGLDAPWVSDQVGVNLTVLSDNAQTQLDPKRTDGLPVNTSTANCVSTIRGWSQVDALGQAEPERLSSWTSSTPINLYNNSMLYTCPSEAGTLAMVVDGSSVSGRGAHIIVQSSGRTILESLLANEPIHLEFRVNAGSPVLVAFVNDLYRPPEDRNLWISDVRFTPY